MLSFGKEQCVALNYAATDSCSQGVLHGDEECRQERESFITPNCNLFTNLIKELIKVLAVFIIQYAFYFSIKIEL